MATPLAMRVAAHQAQIYRRFWRSSVFAYVLNPVLFLAAIGVGPRRSMIDQQNPTVGGFSYIVFVAPGLMAAAAMQGAAADSLWPIMAGTKWMRVFHAMVATPIRPRDVYDGTVGSTTVRAAGGATVFLVVAALFGAVPSLWGVARDPGGRAVRGRVRRAAHRLRRDPGDRPPVPGDHAARHPAAVPRVGHVLPALAAPRLAPTARLVLAAVARGRPVPRRDHRHPRAGSVLVHTAVLVACVVAGRALGRADVHEPARAVRPG